MAYYQLPEEDPLFPNNLPPFNQNAAGQRFGGNQGFGSYRYPPWLGQEGKVGGWYPNQPIYSDMYPPSFFPDRSFLQSPRFNLSAEELNEIINMASEAGLSNDFNNARNEGLWNPKEPGVGKDTKAHNRRAPDEWNDLTNRQTSGEDMFKKNSERPGKIWPSKYDRAAGLRTPDPRLKNNPSPWLKQQGEKPTWFGKIPTDLKERNKLMNEFLDWVRANNQNPGADVPDRLKPIAEWFADDSYARNPAKFKRPTPGLNMAGPEGKPIFNPELNKFQSPEELDAWNKMGMDTNQPSARPRSAPMTLEEFEMFSRGEAGVPASVREKTMDMSEMNVAKNRRYVPEFVRRIGGQMRTVADAATSAKGAPILAAATSMPEGQRIAAQDLMAFQQKHGRRPTKLEEASIIYGGLGTAIADGLSFGLYEGMTRGREYSPNLSWLMEKALPGSTSGWGPRRVPGRGSLQQRAIVRTGPNGERMPVPIEETDLDLSNERRR